MCQGYSLGSDCIGQGASALNLNADNFHTLLMVLSAKRTKHSFNAMQQTNAFEWTLFNQVAGKFEAKQKLGSLMGLKLTCCIQIQVQEIIRYRVENLLAINKILMVRRQEQTKLEVDMVRSNWHLRT